MSIVAKPKYLDVCVLSVFTVFITLHPYYLYGQMNLFELGLYLPGINAILDGYIPYRDFFHLRGPFELYMPAILMHFFGENMAILLSYFYIGTVITLILCVILGKQLLTTRLFYYLAVFVLVAKTFPRVVFTYWGGMRFALGLLTIVCAIQYFKNKKSWWIFVSGMMAACSLWTSVEMGAYAFTAVATTLILCMLLKSLYIKESTRLLMLFFGGFLIVGLPYGLYLHINGALLPYFEATLNIVRNMENTFPQTEAVPQNFLEAVLATLNPGSKNFKHLTPVYLYVFLTAYLVIQIRKKKFQFSDYSIVCLALYGFVFFVGSFRNIWSSNFEMMLQPEKILLFVLLERMFFILKDRKNVIVQELQEMNVPLFKHRIKIWSINIFIGGVILSSIGYPIQRYNKRFFAFKYMRNVVSRQETASLKPLHDSQKTKLDLERVRGLTVPDWQARDFTKLTQFVNTHTSSQDAILMYPEGASYSFIIDRPFVGRFPMANFSWFNDEDHDEYLASLKKVRAPFAVVPKELPHYFDKTHFIVKANKKKYDEVMRFINQYYEVVDTTPTLNILKWRP